MELDSTLDTATPEDGQVLGMAKGKAPGGSSEEEEEEVEIASTVNQKSTLSGLPESGSFPPQLKFRSKIPSSVRTRISSLNSSSSATSLPQIVPSLDVTKSLRRQGPLEEDSGTGDTKQLRFRGEGASESQSSVDSGESQLSDDISGDRSVTQLRSTADTMDKKTRIKADGSFVGLRFDLKLSKTGKEWENNMGYTGDSVVSNATTRPKNGISPEQSHHPAMTSAQPRAVLVRPSVLTGLRTVSPKEKTTQRVTQKVMTGNMKGEISDSKSRKSHITGDFKEENSPKANKTISDKLSDDISVRANDIGHSYMQSHGQTRNCKDDTDGVQSSFPDVVSPSGFFPTARQLECASEEEEAGEEDYLGTSQDSLTSSLGILNESDILDVSGLLVPEEFRQSRSKSADNKEVENQGQGQGQPEMEREGQRSKEEEIRGQNLEGCGELELKGFQGEEELKMEVGPGKVLTYPLNMVNSVLGTDFPPHQGQSFAEEITTPTLSKDDIHDSKSEHDDEERTPDIDDRGKIEADQRDKPLHISDETEDRKFPPLGDEKDDQVEVRKGSKANYNISGEDDNKGFVIQVQLERQLFDCQQRRLSYDDHFNHLSNNWTFNVECNDDQTDNKSDIERLSSPCSDRGQYIAVLEDARDGNVGKEENEEVAEAQMPRKVEDKGNKAEELKNSKNGTEINKGEGGGGSGGNLGNVTNKAKMIQNLKSQQLNVGNEWKHEDTRRPSMEKLEKSYHGGHQSTGKVPSYQRQLRKAISSQSAPVTPKAIAPARDEAATFTSLAQQQRRLSSLDLGNTSSSSSTSSIKRTSLRKEIPKVKSLISSRRKDEGKIEQPASVKKWQTDSQIRQRPGLPVRHHAALTKHNRAPSESNLIAPGAESSLPRRTSTPLAIAGNLGFTSDSVPHDDSRKGSQLKMQQRSKKETISSSSTGPTGQQLPSIINTDEKEEGSEDADNLKQQQWNLQQHYQPDLVPSETASNKNMAEITRLERLCESHSHQIHCLNAEIYHKTSRFHALLVVVQYLSQLSDSDAEKRKCLRGQLNDASDQLRSAVGQIEALSGERDALRDQIQMQKDEEERQKQEMMREHLLQLEEFQERLQKQHEDDLQRAGEEHLENISAFAVHHQQKLNELKESHEQVLSKNQTEHASNLKALNDEHDDILQGLKNQQAHQLEEITLCFDHIKFSLLEKVEILRNECEEMRRREATYMESCQREMEQKLQMALMPYRHLPQEIESLKAVLDLRNLELHGLRHQNFELQKQLEELPAAHETIRRAEQKLENLEAIIKIRTDYERELSEKYQQLLRRYERESKANKRLSMDKEELLWRLSSSSPSSEILSLESFQQMVGHPSALGGGGSQAVSGNDVSAGSAMSLSEQAPLSPGTQDSLGNSRMQRSGTYDLLCQASEDGGASCRISPSKK